MAEPKSTSSRGKSRATRPAPEAEPSQEQLSKPLNPLGVVLLTRERIQAVLDDAVERGRMTRSDATELATTLVERGRRQTEDVLADLEQLVGRGGLPIEDYDDLTAAQITARLGDLTPAQLRRVRDHERRNANRKSVLQAVERRLG